MILYDITLISEDDFLGTVMWANNVTEVCEMIAKVEKWKAYEISDCRIIPNSDPAYHAAICPEYAICPECNERDHEKRMINE